MIVLQTILLNSQQPNISNNNFILLKCTSQSMLTYCEMIKRNTPVWQLWHSWITVDFRAGIWLPDTPQTAATPACFTTLYTIVAICSAINQCLVNFCGSAIIFFILLGFFFSSTPYWFHSQVKPEGNQEPFMLTHISKLKQEVPK